MNDLLIVLATAAFFILCGLYVRVCERFRS